jgi:hypothetical protein
LQAFSVLPFQQTTDLVEKLLAKAFGVRGDCYGVCAARPRSAVSKNLAAKLKCFLM